MIRRKALYLFKESNQAKPDQTKSCEDRQNEIDGLDGEKMDKERQKQAGNSQSEPAQPDGPDGAGDEIISLVFIEKVLSQLQLRGCEPRQEDR